MPLATDKTSEAQSNLHYWVFICLQDWVFIDKRTYLAAPVPAMASGSAWQRRQVPYLPSRWTQS